jgi:tyrosyl-tRNA synthetase
MKLYLNESSKEIVTGMAGLLGGRVVAVYSSKSAAEEIVRLVNGSEAQLAALTGVKAWFQKLEDDTSDLDPLKAMRHQLYHAPVHAMLDKGIAATKKSR